MNVSDFKHALLNKTLDVVANDILLAPGAKHVDQAVLIDAANKLRSKFQIGADHQLEVIVVGSAKLGFSVTEKAVPGGRPLPRYREFDPANSDIDLAIVSQKLFFDIWKTLSFYSHQQAVFPWDTQLAKYMVLGWIRPDHFPRMNRPLPCQKWWELFNQFSISKEFGRRKVRGGLYFHKDFLIQYQQRALIGAYQAEFTEASK